MAHFADRLFAAIEKKGGPICVGIDPVLEKLPDVVREGRGAVDAIEVFCSRVLELVGDRAAMVKFQSACFERYFSEGLACLHRLIGRARELDVMVILDAKRGDIGSSAAHYAAGCLADGEAFGGAFGQGGPDALTVNGYFGLDGLAPFMKVGASEGKGLFALVRTSNPGGDAIQSLKLTDGRSVAEAMGGVVAEIGSGAEYEGECGYSLLGAVVGATKSEDAAALREIMKGQIFLVPGFGAQGAGADDVRACFDGDGRGALVTASRSITYAYGEPVVKEWEASVKKAVEEMQDEIAAILG